MGEACNLIPSRSSGWSSRVLPLQHVKTQLDAWHIVQTDNGPFEAKASHAVEVIRSHCHLLLSNVIGVGSIPPPLNEALHQGITRRHLWKKTNDRLEDCLLDVGPVFRDKKVAPLHYLVGAPLTSIRGWWLQTKKKEMKLDSWFEHNLGKMMFWCKDEDKKKDIVIFGCKNDKKVC